MTSALDASFSASCAGVAAATLPPPVPPLAPPPRLHLILDIDGTLIRDLIHGWPDVIEPRPGLGDFLRTCFAHFASVSLWTAAGESWLQRVRSEVLEPLMESGQQFHFAWSADRCTRRSDLRAIMDGGFYAPSVCLKRLRKVWRAHRRTHTRTNTLILDDTPETYRENRGNAIPIDSWHGEDDDVALIDLTKRLPLLAARETVRPPLRTKTQQAEARTLP